MVDLSRQQMRVAMWLDSPLTWHQIAGRLHMTFGALDAILRILYLKLGVHNRLQAAIVWEQLGRPDGPADVGEAGQVDP